MSWTVNRKGDDAEARDCQDILARAPCPRTELQPRRQRNHHDAQNRHNAALTVSILAQLITWRVLRSWRAMLTRYYSLRFAQRPSITGFDPKKFAAASSNGTKGDPWAR